MDHAECSELWIWHYNNLAEAGKLEKSAGEAIKAGDVLKAMDYQGWADRHKEIAEQQANRARSLC